uniref:phosphatidylserine decarboxylase n=1 Tax=Dracunculus medinensis TaxID=318479 RepID=A0A0N4U7M1_DRAME
LQCLSVLRTSVRFHSSEISILSRTARFFLKWLAAGVLTGGSGIFAYSVFRADARLRNDEYYYWDWKLRIYCSLPFNALSRITGGLASVYIPVWLRKPLIGTYVRTYNCRMDEAVIEDICAYQTFAAFFNRKLKTLLRPISDASLVMSILFVSPADGIIVHCGKINNDKIEFVKGRHYSLEEFLGLSRVNASEDGCDLYQMVIYLAPGNYHGFHAPAEWITEYHIHHPGLLLSVRPNLLQRLPILFCLNERVVLNGQWKHGFFSMIAVAASNVGDISIEGDSELPAKSNHFLRKDNSSLKNSFERIYSRGEKVGEFRLGSSIILIFEAPPTLKFAVKAGDNVRYGQSLIMEDI